MSIPTGARAMEMGTRIVQSIGNRAYGLRDFTLSDPDGFGVRFASLLDAVSNREVGAPVASSRRKRHEIKHKVSTQDTKAGGA